MISRKRTSPSKGDVCLHLDKTQIYMLVNILQDKLTEVCMKSTNGAITEVGTKVGFLQQYIVFGSCFLSLI